MAAFDPSFETETSLVLALAAYDVANAVPARLPPGFGMVANIVADAGRIQSHIDSAPAGQRALFRGMMLESQRPGVFGFVARSSDAVAVCFRGTETPDEWLKDFDFLHVPFEAVPGMGNVHEGFQRVYDTVRESVHAALAACGVRSRTLIVGHSLGAALAVLSAADIAFNAASGPPPEVHNFAGPRAAGPDDPDILNSTFASRFNAAIPVCIRVVNRWDIVPHLPPSVTAYQHVGQGVGVNGGFTLDLARAHNLQLSYTAGLGTLVPRNAAALHMAAVA